MIEFYKYVEGSVPRTPYKYQKYIPKMGKPTKCIQLSNCPANFTPVSITVSAFIAQNNLISF